MNLPLIINSFFKIKLIDFLPSQICIDGIYVNTTFINKIKIYLLNKFQDYTKYSINNNLIKYIDHNILSIINDIHFEYNKYVIYSKSKNIKNKKFNEIETQKIISKLKEVIKENNILLNILQTCNIQTKNSPQKHFLPKKNKNIFIKKSNATKNDDFKYDIDSMFNYIINYIKFINYVYNLYIHIINDGEYIINSDLNNIINNIKPLYTTNINNYTDGPGYKEFELQNIKFPKLYINNNDIYYSNNIIIRCNNILKKNIMSKEYTIFPKRIHNNKFKILLDSINGINQFNNIF